MNNVIYRTYADEVPEFFRKIQGSFINKPVGGLWGCRGSEWYDWCTTEDFPCSENYFEWKLKEDTKVYTVDNKQDFLYLCNYANADIFSIDYLKFIEEEGYDAVELTRNGNDILHLVTFVDEDITSVQFLDISRMYPQAVTMGMNSWDVPSICVFDPQKTVEVLKHVTL